jgi:cobyrinic acid a,c-diamide synthase
MISSIKNFINANKPVYAECGGLMYLAKSIKINNKSFKMVGIINGRVVMHDKPVGRGHVELIKSSKHPWLLSNDSIKAHEFHYSDYHWMLNYLIMHTRSKEDMESMVNMMVLNIKIF